MIKWQDLGKMIIFLNGNDEMVILKNIQLKLNVNLDDGQKDFR